MAKIEKKENPRPEKRVFEEWELKEMHEQIKGDISLKSEQAFLLKNMAVKFVEHAGAKRMVVINPENYQFCSDKWEQYIMWLGRKEYGNKKKLEELDRSNFGK